jgi:hypothetical protein
MSRIICFIDKNGFVGVCMKKHIINCRECSFYTYLKTLSIDYIKKEFTYLAITDFDKDLKKIFKQKENYFIVKFV